MNMKHAILWEDIGNKQVQCRLCARKCVIPKDHTGFCTVRKNFDGVLLSAAYDKICAANVDPIEKKPLFHFQPGSATFSIATLGCNMRCQFCQNWHISQPNFKKHKIKEYQITPEKIIDMAVENGCASLSYTYTEPTIFMELAADCSRLAKAEGLTNVFVSNGYMSREAVDFARGWLDGINIDLKAFSEDFYNKLCGASLQPVLDTIKHIAKETDIWMEITTLIIPGENDSDEELKKLADFIAGQCGIDTPWHISRYYRHHKYRGDEHTPIETISKAHRIGRQAGLRYVYAGNVQSDDEGQNTTCYKCGELLISRTGYRVNNNAIKFEACPKCKTKVAGFRI